MTSPVPRATRPIVVIVALTFTYAINDFLPLLVPPSNPTAISVLWILDLFVYTTIPVLFLAMFHKRGTLNVWRFFRGGRWFEFPIGIVAGAALYLIFEFHLTPFLDRVLPGSIIEGTPFINEPPALKWLVVVYAAVSAGILEELIDRAIVVTQLRVAGLGAWSAGAVSILIATSLHWSMGVARCVGVALFFIPITLWYMRSRSLLGVITLHTTYDFLIFAEIQ